jgi:uncharacterized protein (TIGR00255 family)
MAIKSMTGFARSDGAHRATSWHWEARSVNGRGLDVRVRLPAGLESLEPRVRETVGKFIARGNIAITLSVKKEEGGTEVRLNEAALRQVLAALDRLKALSDAAPPRAEGLLALKGVLEVVDVEESASESEERCEGMLASLEEVLQALVKARAEEGLRLQAAVREQLSAIRRLVSAIEASPARKPEAIRQRLKEQVARLMEAGMTLDETRLYQEAAILTTRADIEEELKRLHAHIAAAHDLLEAGEPAGRRLDFLAQEFQREANTLCAKASDADIVRAGLELKAVIDQMREQVQNIE